MPQSINCYMRFYLQLYMAEHLNAEYWYWNDAK
jgi:hypothetical protein